MILRLMFSIIPMPKELPGRLVKFTFRYSSPGYSDSLGLGWGFNLQCRCVDL